MITDLQDKIYNLLSVSDKAHIGFETRHGTTLHVECGTDFR